MSHSRYSEISMSPRSGSGGSTTPRGSFRSSREDLLNGSFGSHGSNPDLRYDLNDQLEDWRHGIVRRESYAYREGRLFTDVLDELEYQIRKAEDESTALIHDFNVIRNQHQSQTRRINDLVRGFDEARYVLDHMRTGRYGRRNTDRRPSEDRSRHRESVDVGRRRSMDRVEHRQNVDRLDRKDSLDRADRHDGYDRDDEYHVKQGNGRDYRKRSPELERPLKSKSSSRDTLHTTYPEESQC